MKTRTSLLISCITLSAFLFGCDSDDAYEHSGVQCHATYVIDDSGVTCYFGECGSYDNDLRDHYCPSAASYCIEDNTGKHYCGTHCPDDTIQSGSMCNRVGNKCESKEIFCDSVCIDPKTSKTYCGSDAQCIAHECLPDQICANGICTCPESQSLCDDKCVDIQKSVEHCGNCNTNCTSLTGWADGKCNSGQCTASACIEGYHTSEQENGSIVCEQDITDPCGSSGEICPLHSVCDPETESCKCEEGFDSCENGCFDFMGDTEHCGNCETVCSVDHADNECNNGICSFTCQAGYDISADGNHCELQQTKECTEGEKRCNDKSYEICQDGVWTVLKICTEESQCNPDSGCESKCGDTLTFCPPNVCTNIQADNENCGGCGNKCNVANAKNICELAKCSFTCKDGYVKTEDGKGCESVVCTNGSQRCSGPNVQTCKGNNWVTTKTCTAISNSSATCKNGICGWNCNAGYTQCSGQCINSQTDTSNCGKCGTKCNIAHATNTCSSGKCSFICDSGYITTTDGKGCEAKVCNEGSKRCDGLNYQTCQGNKWVTSKTCTTSDSNAKATCNNTTGCDFSCNSKYTKCSDKCVILNSDNKNCGRCGNECKSVANGDNTCTSGNCKVSCDNNYLECNNSCVSSSKEGIVNKLTQLYTSPGGSIAGNVTQYNIYPVYGKYNDYYAISVSNQKRYIDNKYFYILPATGKVESDDGLVIRQGPTRASNKIGSLLWQETTSIVGYETGELINGVGWFKITSPMNGYVAAYYVRMVSGSSAGGLKNCP